MRIPQDKIEEVRHASDILSIVGEYVALKKRGQNYFGLCPFHSEDTPSFSVHPGRQIFRCFGCGRGGNVFGFLMEVERVTFIEAVRMLAARSGIELPRYERSADEGPSQSEMLVQANGIAQDFFHSQVLNAKSPDAVSAREYLTKRGYSEDVIRSYMIGYAPDSWDALTQQARASRIPVEIMMQAGLLKRGGETNRVYDVFRDRIMFPIRNLSGRVIAFGGRRLKEPEGDRQVAKYVNSPETAVYNKSRELFGLWEARNEIRRQDRAILVEGYTDTISLVSAGVPIACASLGTSLTENQARLLKRFTSNVFILYDGDGAGVAAALRAVDVLHAIGATPRVIPLPEGEDPDSFVQREGAEALWEKLNSALTPVDFRIQVAKREGRSTQQMIHSLLESAAQIGSPVDQEIFVQEVSTKTGIGVDTLLKEMSRFRRTTGSTTPADGERDNWPAAGALTALVELLVRTPEVRGVVFEHWSPPELPDTRMRELLMHLYEEWQSGQEREPETILDQFTDPPVRDFLTKCLAQREEENEDQIEVEKQLAQDCLRSLEVGLLRDEIRRLKEALSAKPEDVKLLAELQELMRRQRELRHAP